MTRLRDSRERFTLATFDALLSNIAILDGESCIIAVNLSWEIYARNNALPASSVTEPEGRSVAEDVAGSVRSPTEQGAPDEELGGVPGSGVGVNYLALCEATQGEDRPYALSIAANIRAVLGGQQDGESEYPCLQLDGLHYYLARVSGFVQDGLQHAVVAHEDITQRKLAELEVLALNHSLEQRVQERGHELEKRNAELGRIGVVLEQRNEALIESNLQLARFAHVASHDLQEPLRIVGTYVHMLRHRYDQALDSRGQGYLNHITDQVTRARQMVKGVLTFSGVSQPLYAEPTLLEPLWQDAVQFLDWPPDTRLACGELPAVRVNLAQMRQLLGNLLGNSLKFRSQKPLEVSLSLAGQGDGFAELVLRDNGIGIGPDYRQQVFDMFQRLHSRPAYSDQGSADQGSGGNGIGLAICKKIVEHHGGSIWIGENSGAQQGTALHFTLPLA